MMPKIVQAERADLGFTERCAMGIVDLEHWLIRVVAVR